MRCVGLSLLLLACGARTALETEERDAGMIDAGGILDTLPCRWSVGESLELARGASFTSLGGAIDPDVDRAIVAADLGVQSIAMLVTVSQEPALVETLEARRGRWFSGAHGYLQQRRDACAVISYDGALAEVGSFAWSDDACAVAQSRPGALESVTMGAEPAAATRIVFGDGAEPVVDIVHEWTSLSFELAQLVRSGEENFFASERSSFVLFGSLDRDGFVGLDPRRGSRLSGAPDRLRGGAVFLYRSPEGWQLVWVESPGTILREEPIADLSSLAAEPIGRVVSNETEVIFPLADGSIAYVPVNRSLIRYIDPVAIGVEAMEIVLRPGTSAGVVVYATRDAGEAVLSYRALVCNR